MPSHGLRWMAGAAAAAFAAVGACGYPNFTYGSGSGGGRASSSSTSTSGSGGSGGAAVSTVTSTVASTVASTGSAGGGGGGPKGQVSCADGADLCNPGQVCCFNEGDSPDCDKCFDDTTCSDNRVECQQAPYDVYECDNDADCGGTMHCCAQIISENFVQQVRCYTQPCSDASQTRQMCHNDDDCPGEYPTCSDFGYAPYKVCE